jgi:phosphatidylserine/phosphatidylglycerophosphate/cardiolipin synthase-like enzyme
MQVELDLLDGEETYRRVMREEIPNARHSVMIATAVAKQTTLELESGQFLAFFALAEQLLARGVKIGILLAGKPSRPFAESYRKFPLVRSKLPLRLCYRQHSKAVIVDGSRCYLGSANLSQSGMGRRSAARRNVEIGFFTADQRVIRWVSDMLGEIWSGKACENCLAKRSCFQEHQKMHAVLAAASEVEQRGDRPSSGWGALGKRKEKAS